MHILYIQQELILPGARGNGRCWEMAQNWTQAGHQVTFLSSLAGTPENRNREPQRSTGKHQSMERDGITIHTVDVGFSHMMSIRRRIWSFIQFYRKAHQVGRKLSGFDVILAYTAPLTVASLGQKLSREYGVPFFLEVADVWPDVPIGMGIVKNRLLASWLNSRTNQMYEGASGLFPYTEGMRDQILSHGPFADKTHVLHNGANRGEISFVDRSQNAKPINVLYAGTIGRANGLTQFVRAVHTIEQSGHDDIRFTILGTGNDERRVKAEAERLEVKSLTFLPAVGHEEVPRIMQSADIGIASIAPYEVLEANGATKFFSYLASGLPVVINYEGWQADYLQSRECGLFSKCGDEKAFAENIVRLAKSPELRAKFARNGRGLAEEAFDRRKIAPRYISLMQELH